MKVYSGGLRFSSLRCSFLLKDSMAEVCVDLVVVPVCEWCLFSWELGKKERMDKRRGLTTIPLFFFRFMISRDPPLLHFVLPLPVLLWGSYEIIGFRLSRKWISRSRCDRIAFPLHSFKLC